MVVFDKPQQAFIMAAGFGSRLRPYTVTTPKPLVPLAGRPLMDYLLDHLRAEGVRDVVMNAHYLAPAIEAYARQVRDVRVRVSCERTLLDTGGGLLYALPLLDHAPFYTINGDAFWESASGPSLLGEMARVWDTASMDILIALQPVSSMRLTQGVGDYRIDSAGRAVRALDKTGTHMFTSVRIQHPRIFVDYSVRDGAFSYLKMLDAAEREGRLYAYEHMGDWHHISTPDDLHAVEAIVKDG